MAAARHQANLMVIVGHFDQNYGRNDNVLASWQQLCQDVRVEEGRSITQCKKNLKGIYVNIVDFVQAKKAGRAVHTFSSAHALNSYMQNAGRAKIFPLRLAKQNKILNWMLIELR